MRSRLSDGVMIVVLGLTVLTAALHAMPVPPGMPVSMMAHPSGRAHLGAPVRMTPRSQAS